MVVVVVVSVLVVVLVVEVVGVMVAVEVTEEVTVVVPVVVAEVEGSCTATWTEGDMTDPAGLVTSTRNLCSPSISFVASS